MKTSKHTPGPWRVEFEKEPLAMNGVGNFAVNGPKGIICRTEESSIEETEANARLIAAAPELLEALKDANKALLAHGIDPSDQALFLIEKIEGGEK